MKAPIVDRLVDEVKITDADRALLWRAEVLEHAGYDEEAVPLLALDFHVDLHLAVDLISRGCPQETALRILL